ncbi:MAG: Asp-tRNA(Asn)/Glu-tRNA(Gln) amidotransferase subunit GatB [Candidatus Omnitrophota bacterium]
MEYEIVIGLEVHTELLTASKMFCGCANRFGAEPNSLACPVCLGFPGTLPVINEKAIELALKTALALECRINPDNLFARKNYFYPDMPKNYQISQYEEPLAVNGSLMISAGGEKKIHIRRVHLEEDVGKLIHPENESYSLVDFNRAGVPLLEIVTEPDINSPDQAFEFLNSLKTILQYLEVSDCNMEEGSLRCDANISLRPSGHPELGTKVEVKNMNSFRAVRLALKYEAERQSNLISSPRKDDLVQETRLWNEKEGATFPMRTKEEAQDYRYFPEPDLLPLKLSDDFIQRVRCGIMELPAEKAGRFRKEYQIPAYDAGVITASRYLADFFETVIRLGPEPKTVSNWLMTEVLSILKEESKDIKELGLSAESLAEVIRLVSSAKITSATGKEVLRLSLKTGKKPAEVVAEKGLSQISDTEVITRLAGEALTANPKSVEDYRNGKKNALAFLIGSVMRQTKGKANPKLVQEILLNLLEKQ